MAGLRFDRVGKRYGDNAPVVAALDLELRDGESIVLVGPLRRQYACEHLIAFDAQGRSLLS
jgi:hypothetical protein